MNAKQKIMLHRRYCVMLAGIEDSPIYDGRGKGVDVYVCEFCGAKIYTRYKDKGVTPYIMPCTKCGNGYAKHQSSIGEDAFLERQGLKVLNWIRPTFEQICGKPAAFVDHVLKGGLVLEGAL